MLKKFIGYYLKKFQRYFENNTKSRLIVTFLMAIMVFLLAAGIYILTREGLGLTQVEEDEFVMKAGPLYIYQLFLLLIGFLIFASTVIFGLFNFFKESTDAWIMSSPSYNSLPRIKFFRALFDSSWPIVILAIPLLLAIQSTFSLSAPGFILALATIIVFSLFSGSSAIILTFFLASLMKLAKIKSFKLLAAGMGVITVGLGILAWSRVVAVDIAEIFQVEEALDPKLNAMKENFSIFPSHFAAMVIHKLNESFQESFKYFGIVFGMFAGSLIIFELLKNKYLYIWQTFQEGSFEAKNKKENEPRKIIKGRTPKTAVGVIFKKEFLTSIRSPQNIFWFSFLMLLMLAQVGVVNLLETYTGIGASHEMASAGATPSLQLGVIFFFISAFVLRFVFPAFSQEGSTSWIIGAAPINLKKIFDAKLYFYGVLLVVIGLIALSIYVIPLTIAPEIVTASLLMILIGVPTLTIIGLSIGTIFANFKTDDPQKLSTSAPGIAFIITSLTYSVFGAYLLYRFLSTGSYFLIAVFISLSIIISVIFKKVTLKSLKKIEFI